MMGKYNGIFLLLFFNVGISSYAFHTQERFQETPMAVVGLFFLAFAALLFLWQGLQTARYRFFDGWVSKKEHPFLFRLISCLAGMGYGMVTLLPVAGLR